MLLKQCFWFFLIEGASAGAAPADAEFAIATNVNDLGLDQMEPINSSCDLDDGMTSMSKH